MPSVRYYNQTAPFWDFVASLEDQGAQHPLFSGQESGEEGQRPGWGWPFGQVPHRGRHGHHHRHQPGPPPPDSDEPAPPPPAAMAEDEKGDEAGPSEPRGPPHFGPGAHRGRGGPWARRGGCHGRGFRGGFPFAQGGAPFWADMLRGFSGDNAESKAAEDFTPDADVFDTPDSFVVHVSLPGAKKDDVGVNWDAEKSELSIAGVVYRPGDEDFLKTLALNERSVGAFERKIRLGSRANPAQVDADAITARMEDGVLTIEVPKLDSGYVEVKKVDIE